MNTFDEDIHQETSQTSPATYLSPTDQTKTEHLRRNYLWTDVRNRIMYRRLALEAEKVIVLIRSCI